MSCLCSGLLRLSRSLRNHAPLNRDFHCRRAHLARVGKTIARSIAVECETRDDENRIATGGNTVWCVDARSESEFCLGHSVGKIDNYDFCIFTGLMAV